MSQAKVVKCAKCQHIYLSDEQHTCPTPQYEAERDQLVHEAAQQDAGESAEQELSRNAYRPHSEFYDSYDLWLEKEFGVPVDDPADRESWNTPDEVN